VRLDGEQFYARQTGQIDRPENQEYYDDEIDEELQGGELDESQTINANEAGPSNRVKNSNHTHTNCLIINIFSHYQRRETMSPSVNSINTAWHFVLLAETIFTGYGLLANWLNSTSLPLSIGSNAINWTIRRNSRRK
jgi:hypothetical protein